MNLLEGHDSPGQKGLESFFNGLLAMKAGCVENRRAMGK